jgi:hypothetical protein
LDKILFQSFHTLKTEKSAIWKTFFSSSKAAKIPSRRQHGASIFWAVFDAKVAIAGIQAQGASNDREADFYRDMVSSKGVLAGARHGAQLMAIKYGGKHGKSVN